MKSRTWVVLYLIVLFLLIHAAFVKTMFQAKEQTKDVGMTKSTTYLSAEQVGLEEDAIDVDEDPTYVPRDPPVHEVYQDWFDLLWLMKDVIQSKRFCESVDLYAYNEILSLSYAFKTQSVKNLIEGNPTKEVLKRALKEKLAASMTYYPSMIPDSFWTYLFQDEESGGQSSYKDMRSKIKKWQGFWRHRFSNSMKKEEELKELDAKSNQPPIWDMEQIESLKLNSMDIIPFIVAILNQVISGYKAKGRINPQTMVVIAHNCFKFSERSGWGIRLFLDVWENLVVVSIPDNTYLSFETYDRIVRRNIGSLQDALKEPRIPSYSFIIFQWKKNIAQYIQNTGNWTKPHILDVILRQCETLIQMMEKDLKASLTFEDMVKGVGRLIQYGEAQQLKIPKEFLVQVFFISKLSDPTLTQSYIRKVRSRLVPYHFFWVQGLKGNLYENMIYKNQLGKGFNLIEELVIDIYRGVEIRSLESDTVIIPVSNLKPSGIQESSSYSSTSLPSTQEAEDKRTKYAVKLFKNTNKLFLEVSIYRAVQLFLDRNENASLQSAFLLPIGYINTLGKPTISQDYRYGLVYTCRYQILSLSQLISQNFKAGPLPLEFIQALMYQLFVVVSTLHKIGIWSLNLEPNNILVDTISVTTDIEGTMKPKNLFEYYKQRIRVFIINFEGCAHAPFDDQSYLSQVEWPEHAEYFYDKLNYFTSNMYQSPSLLLGAQRATPKDDIWSLGMILFILCVRQGFLDPINEKTLYKTELAYCILPTAMYLQRGGKSSSSLIDTKTAFSYLRIELEKKKKYEEDYRKFRKLATTGYFSWRSINSYSGSLYLKSRVDRAPVVKLYFRLGQLEKFKTFWKGKPFERAGLQLLEDLLKLNEEGRMMSDSYSKHSFFIYS